MNVNENWPKDVSHLVHWTLSQCHPKSDLTVEGEGRGTRHDYHSEHSSKH